MTQREEFEIWCASVGFVHISLLFNGKMYVDGTIQNMWVTWQAAKAQAVPQWIPVSERLPYDDELVLVYDSEGTHGHVYTLRVYKQFFDKFKCATHWMPLPKAPEQK